MMKSDASMDDNKSAITSTIQSIIDSVSQCQQKHEARNTDTPFVVLTYAQTIDGKIAMMEEEQSTTTTSSNFVISGHASMEMTHALRSRLDGILVGGTTFDVDRPRLTNRLWRVDDHQPRPIILDSRLTRLEAIQEQYKTRRPIVCCAEDHVIPQRDGSEVVILPCRCCTESGNLDWSHMLSQLRSVCGIRSVMVEGGAAVISSLYANRLWDALCITISPQILGKAGMGPMLSGPSSESTARTFLLGQDAVMLITSETAG